MSAESVIQAAQRELGTTEWPAGSNRTKYGQQYGLDGLPWCVMFLWWCFREGGESGLFYGGEKTASCTALKRWYQAAGQWVTGGYQPGDVVLLNFSGTAEPEHCGLVTEVMADGSICTIEGNTSPGMEGSQDNGGCVAHKQRVRRHILGACRPAWTPAASGEAQHWAGAAIAYVRQAGLMIGFPDGSFRPEQPVSRGELAEVLRRMEEKRK